MPSSFPSSHLSFRKITAASFFPRKLPPCLYFYIPITRYNLHSNLLLCHHAVLLAHYPAALPSYYLAILLPCYFTSLPSYRLTILLPYHLTDLPSCCLTILLPNNITISPSNHHTSSPSTSLKHTQKFFPVIWAPGQPIYPPAPFRPFFQKRITLLFIAPLVLFKHVPAVPTYSSLGT